MNPAPNKASESRRIHIFVTGKVQGVGFRAFVQHAAEQLGLTGWVRNLGYNQVETVAEGQPDILDQFLKTIQTGPRSSRIDEVEVRWETPQAATPSFMIKYH
jgi:acylphosphatase